MKRKAKRKRDVRAMRSFCVELADAPVVDTDKRTIELQWYGGSTVIRQGLFEEFNLTFSMAPKSVRLERMNDGAPVRFGHKSPNDPSNIIGAINKAWLSGQKGLATARLSSRDEVTPILADIRDRILSKVSMEVRVHEMEEVTKKGDEIPHMLATDWEPIAVAFVAVGADPTAQAHALASDEEHPCIIHLSAEAVANAQEATMKKKVRLLADVEELGVTGDIVEIEADEFDEEVHSEDLSLEAEEEDEDEDALSAARKKKAKAKRRSAVEQLGDDPRAMKRKVDDGLERKTARETEVKRVAAAYGLGADWARAQIDLGTDIDQVMELAAEERAKRAPKRPSDIGFGEDYESRGFKFEQMSDAIAFRSGRSQNEKDLPESAREYADCSLVELALEVLQWKGMHRGLNARRHSSRIVNLALTTSDYPNLLANAANKILLPDYDHATPTYRMLSERQDLPDFKTASVLKAGDFPIPLQVGEEGEVKLGKFSEAKDTFALATYARRVLFSFASIVNDDLGALGRVMRGAAARLADYENSIWFVLLQSASGAGPTLGDAGAMFNATAVTTAGGHANLTSSGTAIDVTSLGVGRAMMRKQKSLDGLLLNVIPSILLASPDKEGLARQYTLGTNEAVAPTSKNPWAGTLTPMSDANLSSANPWYLFADPSRFPVSVYGYLSGQSGPDVASRQGFEVLGVEMRVALHFGTAFIDFRGAYRNAGA